MWKNVRNYPKDCQSILVIWGNWLFDTKYALFEYSVDITGKAEQPKRENDIVYRLHSV